MSTTSAVNYYKRKRCQERHQIARRDLVHAEEMEIQAEHAVLRAQAMLARTQTILSRCQENTAQLRERINSLPPVSESEQDAVPAFIDDEPKFEVIMDPRTGLKQGEEVRVHEDDDHDKYLEEVSKAREFMAKGLVKEAMESDRKATDILKTHEFQIDQRAIFAVMNDDSTEGGTQTVQVNAADFVQPWSFPEGNESLSQTLSFAKNLCWNGLMDDRFALLDIWGSAMDRRDKKGVPDNVNPIILMEILGQVREIQRYLKEEGDGERVCMQDILSAVEAESDEGGNEEIVFDFGIEEELYQRIEDHREFEEEEDDLFENFSDSEGSEYINRWLRCSHQREKPIILTKNAWKAIETAISNKQSQLRKLDAEELELPTPESSDIARYNHNAHFSFKSEEATSKLDCLFDSLINCKLRSRPLNYSKEKPKFGKVPFVIRTYDNSGFDVDGELIAMCGDERHDDLIKSKNFVGFQRVPCPLNLESSETICDLRDSNDSSDTWDKNVVKHFSKKECHRFGGCVADAANNRVWAYCSRTGEVHGFSTEHPESGSVAKLSFSEAEVKANSRFEFGSLDLTLCGKNIIGSGGTGCLSVWDVDSALNEFDDNNDPILPRTMVVDNEENFACGNVQCVGSSNLLVAPLITNCEIFRSSSVRLYDVNAEKVLGLFCGTLNDVSIGKQHCVESHSSVFVMGHRTGVVFDIRTFQPTIVLHTGGDEQILGVPTNTSTPVAFTYGSKENIKCWDLRMPGSHVYTMATGNTIVNSLGWHEGTSSLLASTVSRHIILRNNYGGDDYLYGEDLGKTDVDMYQDNWLCRADHNKGYFGREWHYDCNCSFAMLQYAFQNGRGMHESVQNVVSPEKRGCSSISDLTGTKKLKL